MYKCHIDPLCDIDLFLRIKIDDQSYVVVENSIRNDEVRADLMYYRRFLLNQQHNVEIG